MFFDEYLNENQYITETFKSIEEMEEANKKIKNIDRDFWPHCVAVLRCIAYIGATPALYAIGAVTGGVGGLTVGAIISFMGTYLIPMCTKWIRMPNSPDDQIVRCDKFIKECEKTIKKIDNPKFEKKLNEAIKQTKKERMDIINKLDDETRALPKYKKYFE